VLGLQYTGMALRHWKEWLPTMYREMKEDGTLNLEAQAASKRAVDQIVLLMESGYQRHEAEEVVLPEEIRLRPERGVE